MIDPLKLQLGNAVTLDGENHFVVSIRTRKIGLVPYNGSGFGVDWRPEDIDPIKITPEWLKRCGFEKRMVNGVVETWFIKCTPKGYKHEYVLEFWFGAMKSTPKGVCDRQYWKTFNTSGVMHDFGLKYIHELQNTYKMICGRDLI